MITRKIVFEITNDDLRRLVADRIAAMHGFQADPDCIEFRHDDGYSTDNVDVAIYYEQELG